MTKERLSKLWDKHLIIGAPIGLKALREGKEEFFAAIVAETKEWEWEEYNKIKPSDLTPYLRSTSPYTIGATKNKATYQGGESVFSMSTIKEFEEAIIKKELLEKVKLIVAEYFDRLRKSEEFHQGLGDIRLTIGMQEELLVRIEKADIIVQRQENRKVSIETTKNETSRFTSSYDPEKLLAKFSKEEVTVDYVQPVRYFFDRDDSSHWHMIPVGKKEEWDNLLEKACEEDEDAIEELNANYSQYRLPGGITTITFQNPIVE